MPTNANLTITLTGSGTVPPPGTPPRQPPPPPDDFDPLEAARKRRQREQHREQEQAAYESLFGRPPVEKAKSSLDVAKEEMLKAERERRRQEFEQEVKAQRLAIDPTFAQQEKERTRPRTGLTPVDVAWDQAAKGQQERLNKKFQEEVSRQRRLVDPAFDREQREKEVKEQNQAQMNRLGKAGQVAGAAGFTGPGRVISAGAQGAALGGPIGAAVMAGIEVLNQAKQMTLESIQTAGRFGQAIGKIDADGFQREMLNVTKKMGPLGEVAGEVGDAFKGMLDAISQTAERLAGFSPDLALAQADVSVNQLRRQMEQAQTLNNAGLSNFVRYRDEINAKIERQLTKLLAALLPFINATLVWFDSALRTWEDAGSTMDAINSAAINIPGMSGQLALLINIFRRWMQIQETVGAQSTTDIDTLIRNLLGSGGGSAPLWAGQFPGYTHPHNPNIPGLQTP